MARGKYLSLEDARKMKRLDRFCKEHPSQGDERRFDAILDCVLTKERWRWIWSFAQRCPLVTLSGSHLLAVLDTPIAPNRP